jgi:hypothetical protein
MVGLCGKGYNTLNLFSTMGPIYENIAVVICETKIPFTECNYSPIQEGSPAFLE